jgi:REP element-mobilizing transposase RayT
VTAPRLILPGRFYLVSRRCTQRQFLLRPDDRTTHIFRYCLAEAAERFDVKLIAWTTMSNHYHTVVYDAHGVLPQFLEHLHKMAAKALNARWGRWENFWAAEEASYVHLVEMDDVFDKVVYVLSNPLTDHLVDCLGDWPGDTSWRQLDGRRVVVERPKTYFRSEGPMKDRVPLVAELPPGWTRGRQVWVDRVREAVLARGAAAREERLRRGIRVVGRKRLRRVSPFDRPSTHEPRRNLRPNIACKRRERREEALAERRRFHLMYERARRRLRNHERAVFPAGTYRYRLLGLECEPVPPAPS